mmetsp:Transcript_27326/g.43966  ORF Transcript_27326/g.43966 Transcript_27326/m.43966 type:complete len:102 (-) Transcript_27326:628-933(-)
MACDFRILTFTPDSSVERPGFMQELYQSHTEEDLHHRYIPKNMEDPPAVIQQRLGWPRLVHCHDCGSIKRNSGGMAGVLFATPFPPFFSCILFQRILHCKF